jgi:hypothetical protein
MNNLDMAQMTLTGQELDLMRQWFDAVQDLNPDYLEAADYEMAAKIYKKLGMRVPNSIADKLVS